MDAIDPPPDTSPSDPVPAPGGGRPAVITVLGVVCIALGLLALACAPLSFLSLQGPPTPPSRVGSNRVFLLMRDPTHRTILAAATLIGVIAGNVQVVAGVGMLGLRRWGRATAIGSAGFGVFAMLFALLFNHIFLWDANDDEIGYPDGLRAFAQMGGVYSGVGPF